MARASAEYIQELEGIFRGAGWNVIKTIWGGWDPLIARDSCGSCSSAWRKPSTGSTRTSSQGQLACRTYGKYPELAEVVAGMTDDDLALNRGRPTTP